MGKYELVALLALGGTAEIYLARIGGVAGFEKYVVVKCLHDHLADDSEFVRMFLDEARLSAQLDHSNIVQTTELGEEGGRYYIVMEYLAGMSLSLLARRTVDRVPGGLMPVDLTLCIAAQACAGLHYAHQRHDPSGVALNIVHRDVSPQNLVVSFEGIVKLVDFGIAKAEMRDTHTRSGTIKGKFAYMSPEQCTAGAVDHRTDIFAMGVVVHELLTGRRLFKRASTYDTYRAIVEDTVPKPSTLRPEITPDIDDVLMKALAYQREARYPSAEAFGEALTALLHRRGKAVSAGMVATFFEQHFENEIAEHGARMRALIAGRQTVIDEQWDDPGSHSGVEEEELDSLERDSMSTIDIAMGRSRNSRSGSRGVRSESAVRVSTVEFGDESTEEGAATAEDIDPVDDDSDEATRVEMNPLLEGQAPPASEAEAKAMLAQLDKPQYNVDAALAQTLALPADSNVPDELMPSPADLVTGAVAHENAVPVPAQRASSQLPLSADDASGPATLVAGSADAPQPPRVPSITGTPKGRRKTASEDFVHARTAPAGPSGLRNSDLSLNNSDRDSDSFAQSAQSESVADAGAGRAESRNDARISAQALPPTPPGPPGLPPGPLPGPLAPRPNASSQPLPAQSQRPDISSQPLPAQSQRPDASSQPLPAQSQRPDASSQPLPAQSQRPGTSSQPLPAQSQRPDVSSQPLPAQLPRPGSSSLPQSARRPAAADVVSIAFDDTAEAEAASLHHPGIPVWLLAVLFVASVGLGLGVTLLIAKVL